MRTYSQEIATTIQEYLNNHDWTYNFHEEDGIFRFSISLSRKIKTLDYTILVHDHSFLVSVRFPLGPDPHDEQVTVSMMKFLTRANYGLRNGNFEMDLEDGEIRYKVFCSCADICVSQDMSEESIHCPAAMFKKYESGLLGVLFEGVSDLDAIQKCETAPQRILSRLEGLKDALEKKLAAMRQAAEVSDEDEAADADETDDDIEPVEDDDAVDGDMSAPHSFASFLEMLATMSADDAPAEDEP